MFWGYIQRYEPWASQNAIQCLQYQIEQFLMFGLLLYGSYGKTDMPYIIIDPNHQSIGSICVLIFVPKMVSISTASFWSPFWRASPKRGPRLRSMTLDGATAAQVESAARCPRLGIPWASVAGGGFAVQWGSRKNILADSWSSNHMRIIGHSYHSISFI